MFYPLRSAPAFCVFLACFGCGFSASAQTAVLLHAPANTEQTASFGPQQLEYYLHQAFDAARQEQRFRLNHPGILVAELNDAYFVSAVLNDYPAQKAGLRRGDRLDTIDGSPFHPIWSFNNREEMPSAFSENTRSHELGITRNNQSMQLSISTVYENLYDSLRSAIPVSVQQFFNGNKLIGYVRLWSLSLSWYDLVTYQRLMQSLSHCDGLIIDVRNAYGFLAAEHLDNFFPSRNSYPHTAQTVETDQLDSTSANPGVASPWPAKLNSGYYARAVVIMQNEMTRGGMELFAYQLSKLPRVVTVGTTSAGTLGDYVFHKDGQLFYSQNRELRIDGLEMEGIGNRPDHQAAYPVDSYTVTDPQYEAALLSLMEII
jgi:C-terminal processing protease CtpA/Prc